MKTLIFTLACLVSANTFAATESTVSLPATEVITSMEAAAETKSPYLFKFESWNEVAQSSLDQNADKRLMENMAYATYSLSETKSVRARVGAVTNYDDEGRSDTQFMDTYLQYADSKFTKLGDKDLTMIIRPYLPTNKDSLDSGAIIPQLRTYLMTEYAVTEKFSISPILNPRFYIGDNKFREDGNTYARLLLLLEGKYTFNDTFSYTADIATVNSFDHGRERSSGYLIDTWLSTKLTEGANVNVGVYQVTPSFGSGFRRADNNYYLSLSYTM